MEPALNLGVTVFGSDTIGWSQWACFDGLTFNLPLLKTNKHVLICLSSIFSLLAWIACFFDLWTSTFVRCSMVIEGAYADQNVFNYKWNIAFSRGFATLRTLQSRL